MRSGRRILVVGGESRIGAALAAAHANNGDEVSITSRRRDLAAAAYLDLAKVPPRWAPPFGTDIAYVCAGITSIQHCEQQSEFSTRVNVRGTLEVCRALARANVFIVFFSTSLVFDGDRPGPTGATATSPRCLYGRQKASVEAALQEGGMPSAILRLTKVLTPSHPLLTAWTNTLSQGKTIAAFTDLRMAPITLDTVVSASLAVARRKAPGITHLSAARDISYFEAARHLAQCLGVDAALVQAASARQTLRSPGALQRHADLAMASDDPFSFHIRDPLHVIEACLGAEAPSVLHT